MTSYDAIVERWRDNVLGVIDKPNFSEDNRVYGRGDRLFSYGSHFELARMIRDHRRRPLLWLLNGDTFSVSTTRHQNLTRGALEGTGYPMVIIPHSVMSEAGIDLNSVRIVQVTADTWLTRTIVETEFPKGAKWRYETEVLPGTGCYLHKTTGEIIRSHHEYHARIRELTGPWSMAAESFAEHNAREEAERRQWEEVRPVSKCTGRKVLSVGRGWNEWELFDLDGRLAYRRDVSRHLLGQSLITARVWGRHTRPARFLSGFDSNEARPSYFFCELPRTSRAMTVAEALEDLKPSAVRQAEQLGREVKRQGDIFAIPVPTITTRQLTKQGARIQRMDSLFNTNHVATETATLTDGTTLARGVLRHAPQWRRPDHKRVSLGNQWHVIQKNTVPITV